MTAATSGIRVARDHGGLTVAVEGDLVLESVGRALEQVAAQLADAPKAITLDLSRAGRIDASGVAVAVQLHRFAQPKGIPFAVQGVEGERKLLLDLALRGQDPVPPPRPIGFLREVGVAAISVCAQVVDLIRFSGELALVSLEIVRRPRLLRLRDTLSAVARHGADAVPVVGLIGFLMGLIIAAQTFDTMESYGAKLKVADVVAVSIVRELGPLMTAIILAGRSGAAFAAEIGTMKVTQELDALRTFGLDPVRFLVMPRIVATVVVTPMLSVYASMLGGVGGFVFLGRKGIPMMQYLVEVRDALTLGGFLQGLAKAAVFALLVSGIGCLSGMRTEQGPGAVGASTTRAVVAGIVAIVVADSVLGGFFIALGI